MNEKSDSSSPVVIKLKSTPGEYHFEGFNPENPDRVIVRSVGGDLVGTLDTKYCEPVDTSWEKLKKQP